MALLNYVYCELFPNSFKSDEIISLFNEDFVTLQSGKSRGVNNTINDGLVIVHAGSLSHCRGLRGHSDRTEPSLMLLVTPAPPTVTSQNVSGETGPW